MSSRWEKVVSREGVGLGKFIKPKVGSNSCFTLRWRRTRSKVERESSPHQCPDGYQHRGKKTEWTKDWPGLTMHLISWGLLANKVSSGVTFGSENICCYLRYLVEWWQNLSVLRCLITSKEVVVTLLQFKKCYLIHLKVAGAFLELNQLFLLK